MVLSVLLQPFNDIGHCPARAQNSNEDHKQSRTSTELRAPRRRGQAAGEEFFMAVVASLPTPPGRSNPSAASIKRCHSRTVRLECPDELSGTWDGPVYATLGREPLSTRLTANTPFLDSDGGAQRLVWEATLTIHRHDQRIEDLPYLLRDYVDAVHFIPHWRLAVPHRDFKTELLERPLLSVFRFVRFSTYFVACPRCDTKFVRVTSDGHLCGQVISYAAASRMSLVDDGDLLMEPSSGVCPGHQALPGTPPVSTTDSSPRSVAYITPRGEKTASTVEEYVQATKLSPRRTARDDTDAVDSPPPILPLLRRADTMLTPSDVFAGPARSVPQVLVHLATGASHPVPPAPGPEPTPVSTTSASVRADDRVIQRLFEQQDSK
ncbi:unnamed protein product [Phytophthora fragariaefolia]|uniref:Unnamed protein product n=1 Tax=Phytophthora fragariaefolia TaxID=1490495 RepID=A0A9W6UB36_9STRA|nr:unnamed protein product [Phytophthora fragariaefolia]